MHLSFSGAFDLEKLVYDKLLQIFVVQVFTSHSLHCSNSAYPGFLAQQKKKKRKMEKEHLLCYDCYANGVS